MFQYITRQETLNEYIKYKNEHERESTNLNLLAPNYHFHISRFLKVGLSEKRPKTPVKLRFCEL